MIPKVPAPDQEPSTESSRLDSEVYVGQTMYSFLTGFGLTALFVVILFFMTNVSNAVAGGAAGLTLWVVGGVFFLLPCSVATIQLGILFPYEGSIYSWTHRSFGPFMSFFVGFVAWIPGPLLILSIADLIISLLQGLHSQWLPAPWQQGMVLLVLIGVSSFFATRRQRVMQYMVNIVFVLILLATVLAFVAGLVWLGQGHHSATNFAQVAGWNPLTAANFPLFGVITLGYLGVNLPLNLSGEIFSQSGGNEKHKAIIGHVVWGSLIVLIYYLLATFGVLVVQGPNAGFVLIAPVQTVQMALGTLAGQITAVCIMATLIIALMAYNAVFARFLMVGGIDRRLSVSLAQLNRNRAPVNAVLLQTFLVCVLTVLSFMVIPYIGILPGPATHLATSAYFVVVGTSTVLWAFATLFLFVDLLRLTMYHPLIFGSRRIFPSWVLIMSSVIGLLVGLVAIVDTVLNSYDPPDIPNTSWWWLVLGLTVLILILGVIGAMYTTSEANYERLTLPGEMPLSAKTGKGQSRYRV
jgi:amino acid transporter